jgi:HD-GYP domain-containing protein (c-di-GMP phosphodiesterase class II)
MMLNSTKTSQKSSPVTGQSNRGLETAELRELRKFGNRVNRFGANFAVLRLDGELALLCDGGKFESDHERLEQYGRTVIEQRSDKNRHCPLDNLWLFGKAGQVLAAVLNLSGTAVGVALVDLGELPPTDDREGELCYESAGEAANAKTSCLREMLGVFADAFGAERRAQEQIEKVSVELAQTYEELVLLHKLSTNMKVTESDANYLQMACDNLTDIVSVEGIAIFLEKVIDDEKRLVLCAGSGVIDVDEHTAAIMQSRLAEELDCGKDALLDSEVDSPFKYEWPRNIENIIAVPLFGTDRAASRLSEKRSHEGSMIGLMVAVNRLDKQDFDSTDIKLFNSVANGCAVFVENGRLFADLKDLFIGSLKALTNSIDAKDQYTRGHSERVAFISRWIGERLAEQVPLEDEQIHKFYLAGLLHDIGKMGIAEAVLCKKGKLTEQELNHIRAHPSIGACILGEIKQMRDIVPGVLCHHERVDGKGYPNGLLGEQIPLVGKIVGLADGFDAMTSKRVYRDAMTVEQALMEIESKLGTQFDQQVGRVFVNSNVYQLWDVIQDGFADVCAKRDFSQYGAVAVGTLIR